MPHGTTKVDRSDRIICYNKKCPACNTVTFICGADRECRDLKKTNYHEQD